MNLSEKVLIECGLIDRSEEVREEFAKRTDFTPTAKQLERGLTDQRQKVRFAFFSRSDVLLSEMQKQRSEQGSFSVHSSSSMEDNDTPDTICPFCKTWIISESDTWCKHVAYVYIPPPLAGGVDEGPAANAEHESWLDENEVDLSCCSRRKFDLFCKAFKFTRRHVTGEYDCTYAFTNDLLK